MVGYTTIRLLRARVAVLAHENAALRRENARLTGHWTAPAPRHSHTERDYGPAGQEFVDPVTGLDTWSTPEGAD